MQHSHSLVRSVLTQLAIFIVLTLSITGAWATYTSITAGSIATGQPVNAALMQQIKDNLDDLNARVSATASVPTGAIMAYNLASCPTGWIPANGSSGTPDLRGEFIRGLDSGRGVDTGRTLGSTQSDQIQNHDHDFNFGDGTNNTFFNAFKGTGPVSASSFTTGTNYLYANVSTKDATNANIGLETRPRNVALLYCMKQ